LSKYTDLELETSKCEATGAIWGYGNPMSKANTILLTNQISTIKFEDGTNIKYLLPNKSYKMLGVQINPMLAFRDHLKHITTEVSKLARVLAKRRLSPNRKQLVKDQLLKSKYHAIHLRICTYSQLNTIDKILDRAARNALGLSPSFPTEAIHKPTEEMGLGYAPLKNKATQMGIEHLMDILKKPTDKGYLAYAHTSRVATTYQHWPKETYEAHQAKLPTLRVLSYIHNITRAELEHIPNLQAPDHIAISLRAASKEVDEIRAKQRENILKNLPPKEYTKQIRNQCQPLN